MKSYPYIGGIDSDCKTLFLDECYGIVMEHNDLEITGIPEHDWIEDEFTNITHEYLQNTYGKVVSPEHAEFIAKLCESNEIKLFNNYDEGITHFAINRGELIFTYVKPAISSHDKQITIPLPPKQIQTATPEDEFEMEQIMKNAGDNLVLGCEDSKCDEWPCVNDTVVTRGGSKGVVKISKPDNDGMIVCDFDGEYALAYKNELQKPKTPEEEELYNDIEHVIHQFEGDKVAGRKWLMSKYNITKKPQ